MSWHGASRSSEREILALAVDGFTLDRRRHAGGRQRFPLPKGLQAAPASDARGRGAHGKTIPLVVDRFKELWRDVLLIIFMIAFCKVIWACCAFILN